MIQSLSLYCRNSWQLTIIFIHPGWIQSIPFPIITYDGYFLSFIFLRLLRIFHTIQLIIHYICYMWNSVHSISCGVFGSASAVPESLKPICRPSKRRGHKMRYVDVLCRHCKKIPILLFEIQSTQDMLKQFFGQPQALRLRCTCSLTLRLGGVRCAIWVFVVLPSCY